MADRSLLERRHAILTRGAGSLLPALAELSGAKVGLHQEGLRPKNVVGQEIAGAGEGTASPRPLNQFETQGVLQLGDVF